MSSNLVSVVISTWNRVKELELALNSVMSQTYKNIEIVVVDNASNDGTYEFLRHFNAGSIDLNIILMDSSNYSAMETLNEGFNEATGPYILVMDDDTILDSQDIIERLVSEMDCNYNAAIIATNVKDLNGNVAIQFKDINFNTVDMDYFNNNPNSFKYIDFSGACALFRKDVVEEAGYYDESLFIYWNEADLALKVISMGYDVIFVPSIRPIHLASSVNRIHCRNHFYYIKNGNKIINENLGIRERLVLIPLRTLVYTTKYIRECNPKLSMYPKIIAMVIKSLINIIHGKRRSYKTWDDSLWVRRVYTRFFWKDLYFQIFKV